MQRKVAKGNMQNRKSMKTDEKIGKALKELFSKEIKRINSSEELSLSL